MPMKITNTILMTMYSMNLYIMMSETTGLTSPSIYFDKYNLTMIFMVNMVFIMIGIKMGSSKQSSKMMCLLFLLLIIFCYMFVTMNFYVFYIMFEFSVVPLLYFISAWGYSLERVKSMFYMFLYTFSFSLPFFLLMMYTSKDGIYNMIHGLSQNVSLNPYILFLMMMLFLVKMPLWGMHMWLTKAHVDASTEGSMILAGVVLKLCGMGLMKFYFLYEFQLFSKIMNFFLCLSLMGSIFLSFFIMRQTDLKMMVALSSIVHMCLMLILWIFSSSFSSYTLIVVMVAHGIISPLMFMFLGLLYESLSTRTLYMAKGALSCLKCINILWFLVVIFNMGMPLTMNFLGELFFFINSLMYSKFILITAGVLMLGNGLFSMYLYTLLNSGENNHMSKMKMNTEDILLFYYGLLFVMVALLFF